MTLNGAITQLVLLSEHPMMPVIFRPAIQKVIETISELEAQPEQRWIPVTEDCECDLMDNEEVLVFQKDGTINGQIRHAMFYDFNGKKKFVTWEEGITIYHVLAYMPLPEPYEMEGSAE